MYIRPNYTYGQEIEVRNETHEEWRKVKFLCLNLDGLIVAQEDSIRPVWTWRLHRPIPTKKKRLMTAKELAGKWIKVKHRVPECIFMVTDISFNQIKVGNYYVQIHNLFEYTSTPTDDSSWKSVEVEE